MPDYGKKNRRQRARAPAKKPARRGRRRLSAFGVKTVLAGVALLLCCGAGFCLLRINTITIEGKSPYTAAQIASVSGLRRGASVFFMDKPGAVRHITDSLPYIRTAAVRFSSPTGLVIKVTEDTAAFSISLGKESLLVDSSGKVLELTADPAKTGNLPVIKGIKAQSTSPGAYLAGADRKKVLTAGEIYRTLEKNKLSRIKSVDVSNSYEISANYDGRIQIVIGTSADLGCKLKFASYLLGSGGSIGSGEKGTLDVSQSAQINRASFIPA